MTPLQSDTLKSLARCSGISRRVRLILRDNSPQPYGEAEKKELEALLAGFNYEYRHNGRNEYLSALYNQAILELRPDEYLVILDHDSRFDETFFVEAARSICNNPDVDLFLPLVYCGRQLVSPSRMMFFKGKYLSVEPRGRVSARHAMAINSGMVISARYAQGDFPGYDERFHFYCTDCDFMWKFERLRSHYCVIDYRLQHSLEFYGHAEPFEKKFRRFQEMRRGFLLAMRDRSFWLYALCFLYMDIYSVKFSVQHRDWRFLFVR